MVEVNLIKFITIKQKIPRPVAGFSKRARKLDLSDDNSTLSPKVKILYNIKVVFLLFFFLE